jgi:hypothetical protein
VFVLLLLIGVQVSGGSMSLQSGSTLLMLAVGFGLLAIYIGVFRARNAGAIELFGWILAGIASFAASWGYLSGNRTSLVLLVVAIQIFLAGVLRWFAFRRWRDVDWLAFKPYRFGQLK